MAHSNSLYALLIGINTYDPECGLPPLRGAVNDACAMRTLLVEHLGVPAENIKTLLNADATVAGIRHAFDTHLIAAAETWQSRASDGISLDDSKPAFLFCFSGYGSQARAHFDMAHGGMENTLVAYDSRTPGVYDIRDWELGDWIARLNAASEDITVLLDCSHHLAPHASGADHASEAAQLPEDLRPRVRSCPPDLRLPPRQYARIPHTRLNSPHNWQIDADATILAACRANEWAHEHAAYRTIADAPGVEAEWHGAFSFFLRHSLVAAIGDASVTNARLLDAARQNMRAFNSAQLPQCEGEVEQPPLAGIVGQGVPRPEVPTDKAHDARVAPCGVRILLDRPRDRYILAQRIDSTAETPALYPWIRPVPFGEDLRLEQRDGALVICDRTGTPLAAPYSPVELERAARDLTTIARARILLHGSQNTSVQPPLALQIAQLDLSGPKARAAAIPADAAGEPTLYPSTRLVFTIENQSDTSLQWGLFRVDDDHAITLIAASDNGEFAPLTAAQRLELGNHSKTESGFACDLPAGVDSAQKTFVLVGSPAPLDFAALQQAGICNPHSAARVAHTAPDEVPDVVLSRWQEFAFVSNRIALTVVAPPAVLGGTSDCDLGGAPIRALFPEGFRGVVRHLSLRQAIHLHGMDISAMPPGLAPFPELFAPLVSPNESGARSGGSVIEIDCDDAARRAISPETPLRLQVPPQKAAALMALAYDGTDWFPVGRALGNASEIDIAWLPKVDLAAPHPSAKSASPLRTIRLFLYRILEEPTHDLGLFNVRFVPTGWSANASRATFTRKTAGGELRYTPATPFRAGERVAVVLHGLGGDSATITRWLSTSLSQLGVRYDRIIAYEYEGVGTPVEENARNLAQRLASLGVKTTEGAEIDLYCHSMGALIARCYVETLGGDKYVRSVIMAAAPNLGTPLADAALLAPWLITLAVNLPLPTASGLLIAWAMGALSGEARGLADLSRKSSLLNRLNGIEPKDAGNDHETPGNGASSLRDRRVKVRYYLLAGSSAPEENPDDDNASGAASPTHADRLLQKLAEGLRSLSEWYFGDENDLVVAVRSSLAVRVQQAPGSIILTRILHCNHFGYFESETAAQQVAIWLNSASGDEAHHATPGRSMPQSQPPVHLSRQAV